MAKLGDGVQLERMVAVGRTTPTSVRIWLRAEAAGPHRLTIVRATSGDPVAQVEFGVPAAGGRDLTHGVGYPDDFPGEAPLAPLTAYRFEVQRVAGWRSVGTGRFETAPASAGDTPDRFSIAVLSCHQPFDSEGELAPAHMRVFEVLETILARNEARFAILAGDQMYSDLPDRCSLLDAHYLGLVAGTGSLLSLDAKKVRSLYQDRYRSFFAMPDVQKLYANRSTYPILDDHEIFDDWGSLAVHAESSHAAVLEGARRAYLDYQGSRVLPASEELPASFHYSFGYGCVGVFVMDLRSERRVVAGGNQLYGESQLEDLRAFLAASGDKRLILVVTSVPVVHVPEWLADAGYELVGTKIDFGDQWSLAANRPARDRLLALLLAHQDAHRDQRIVIVGGDVHISCALELAFEGLPPMHQLTASAISNSGSRFQGWAGGQGPKRTPTLTVQTPAGPRRADVSLARRLKGDNPYGGINVGLIEVDAGSDPLRIRFQIWSYDRKGTKQLLPVAKYVSTWTP
jgi:alkaline phosphatase D